MRPEPTITAAIQKKLVSEYALTQPTADNTDIVTAGAILVLQKSDLMLGPTSSSNLYQNTYTGTEKFRPARLPRAKSFLQNLVGTRTQLDSRRGHGGRRRATADSNSGASPRTYVTGEKLWVTKIEFKTETRNRSRVFELFTDAVNDVRYKGALKFPLPKGANEDQVDKLVAEVFKVQPADDANRPTQARRQAAPAAAAAAGSSSGSSCSRTACARARSGASGHRRLLLRRLISPPRRQPTVSLGQTPDQVIAALGQPQKIVKLAKKETYYYKDLKVIFTAGKVSDVQ